MDADTLVKILQDFFREKAAAGPDKALLPVLEQGQGGHATYAIDMAFLYGSWARGHPNEKSDVDVAVVFLPEPTSDDEAFAACADISIELSMRLRREVNVLCLREDFGRPMLYYNAVVLGVLLYAREFERYISFRNRALAHMEDFSLFGPGWQMSIARRNLERL